MKRRSGAAGAALDPAAPTTLLSGRVDSLAPAFLGALVTSAICGQVVAVRIVEVEAYGGVGEDPASHAYRGRTTRNASMFAEPGTAYVYFSYGMHWCLNASVEAEGRAAAVLLRAGEVVQGRAIAQVRRTSPSGRVPSARDLARGPARLCQALGVDGPFDGIDMLDGQGSLRLTMPATPASTYRTGPRVGVARAVERPWRFWLPDEPSVSAYRGGNRADRRQR